MKYMNLKGTDLKISRIALGTAAFGRKYDADTSEKFLDLYCSEGGNLIDTALVYASSFHPARHEQKGRRYKWTG